MIRPPAVAGAFYPANPDVLRADVDAMLANAAKVEAEVAGDGIGGAGSDERPLALIVPHAGYIYSGSTAALAYERLRSIDPASVEKVVIVGPTHRVAVRGLAYPSSTAFETPLGELPIWPSMAQALAGLPFVAEHNLTHQDEHAIEVQLPFIQRLFGEVPIVPLNAGLASGEQVADALEALWDGPQTLLIASSDLSHYLPYDVANAIDTETIGQILTLDGPLDHEQACGATPINGVLEFARRHGWSPRLLGACNSGDGVGDKGRVVGYCAVEFTAADSSSGEGATTSSLECSSNHPSVECARSACIETTAPASTTAPTEPAETTESTAPADIDNVVVEFAPDTIDKPLPDEAGQVLLAAARAAVAGEDAPVDWPGWAAARLGTFVTLTQAGPDGHHDLRGCIGTLSDSRPLSKSVPSNARNAAFNDPRFPALSAAELPRTRFEVSVLSAPEPMDVSSEEEAIAALRPGVDGVILSDGFHHATFLPQVWEELPDPKTFLAHLRAKAGLPPTYWGRGTRLQRYTVQAWSEE